MPKRRQLTLFLNQEESKPIERIRHQFNRQQFDLIKSHITLCREDEIEDLNYILEKLSHLSISNFELTLGKPARFYEGKGVFIPVADTNNNFLHLRQYILPKNREMEPHITIMHPRNSTCTDEIYQQILKTAIPFQVSITSISLIEQEIGQQWNILQTFELNDPSHPADFSH